MMGRLRVRRTADTAAPPGAVGGPGHFQPAEGTPGIDVRAGTTRRAVISRGLWAIVGAAGLGAAGTGVVFGAAKDPAPGAGPARLSLVVRDVRFTSPSTKPGALPDAGAIASPHGALHDATGQSLGRFSAGTLPGSGGQIAIQRFTFADGTIIGMGSGGLDGEEYAVVGGTGRYAGATGTYVAQLRPGAQGRDAEFQISVTGTRG
jgi:hypothetical protein